ncbi:hypothetical protein LEP1GSC067_1710 [Leptospira interrogans serovar Lora str. TE 1992]|uniref:Uncharacterized protein n=1 Tax=Leptospira interrogans serovar Lora str. TE 1992 TaxID=1193028 RepID=M3EA73_LEPIR|nr:hypothetical protein LEP1GSC067_1710 [Leptospira interrogans serovar Lora str. TE 1992]EMN09203.1 hypothetical protein LEP1GSC053_0951 [Leptospira interrogans serovar Muenchen str. Brem 129]
MEHYVANDSLKFSTVELTLFYNFKILFKEWDESEFNL